MPEEQNCEAQIAFLRLFLVRQNSTNPETRTMVEADQPVSAFCICLCMCARLLCCHPQKRLQKAAEVLQQNLISFDITPPLQQLQDRYWKRHAAINCCSWDILMNFLWRL